MDSGSAGFRPHPGMTIDADYLFAMTIRHPLLRAFTAIDISARWAMTAASAECLRASSAAIAS
jgi:hypothetical protein